MHCNCAGFTLYYPCSSIIRSVGAIIRNLPPGFECVLSEALPAKYVFCIVSVQRSSVDELGTSSTDSDFRRCRENLGGKKSEETGL